MELFWILQIFLFSTDTRFIQGVRKKKQQGCPEQKKPIFLPALKFGSKKCPEISNPGLSFQVFPPSVPTLCFSFPDTFWIFFPDIFWVFFPDTLLLSTRKQYDESPEQSKRYTYIQI